MRTELFQIGTIPAVLYGESAGQGYVFLHGQMGCKEEAEAFAQVVCPKGYQVLSIDLPGHGARQERGEELLPWTAVPDIRAARDWAERNWKAVSLRATSIGAYFAMLAFPAPERALLVSPRFGYGGPDSDHDGLGGGHGGSAAGAGRDCHIVRADIVLEVPLLGAGTSGLSLDLSRPHSLWKRRSDDRPADGGTICPAA